MNLQLLNQIVLLAIPIFLILMLGEFIYGFLINKNTYRLNDTISNLSQGILSQTILICLVFFQIGAYELVYQSIGFTTFSPFWETWYGWICVFLVYDFLDYWLHRLSHQSGLLWSSHVVHHQSQLFNFSTALRQESFFPIIACIFFAIMALVGISPYQFVLIGFFVLIYQFWIHTEHIGKLGWIDFLFSTPSNHRVHHAINNEYIDKNFGAVLIIWDRIFGTYQKEEGECIYGTQTPLNSWNPLLALYSVFIDLSAKWSKSSGLTKKLFVLIKSPAWDPELQKELPLQKIKSSYGVYNPLLDGYRKYAVLAIFSLTVIFSINFYNDGDQLPYLEKIINLMIICIGLYYVGYLMESKKANNI